MMLPFGIKGLAAAIRQWINELFESQPHIQRVGYTTWSGNHRMMKLGEKLG